MNILIYQIFQNLNILYIYTSFKLEINHCKPSEIPSFLIAEHANIDHFLFLISFKFNLLMISSTSRPNKSCLLAKTNKGTSSSNLSSINNFNSLLFSITLSSSLESTTNTLIKLFLLIQKPFQNNISNTV